MTPSRHDSLRAALDRIVDRARSDLKQRLWRRTVPEAAMRAVPWLSLGPFLLLLYWLGNRLGLYAAETPSLGLVFAATLIPPFVVAANYLMPIWTRGLKRPDVLGAVDQELGLKDRLQTADEFLTRNERSDFMEAALLDAETHAQRAEQCSMSASFRSVKWSHRESAFLLLALAVIAGLFLLEPRILESHEEAPNFESASANAITLATENRDEAKLNDPPTEPKPRKPTERAGLEESLNPTTAERYPSDQTPVTKESQGKTASGPSSEAATATGATDSRGQPSSRSESKTDDKRRELKGKKPKAKPRKPKDSDPRTPPDEESGSTAGRGMGNGSHRNPAATEWKSRDNVVTAEEEPFEEEEEVEDEDSDQEARGGVQPHLRDRRPPVSRDLQIGFGNQKNPDANGRSGPSAQKKSRGVAALVLGVPIPDQIKGQPNPGRTKVTQERVEPRSEDAEPIVASTGDSRQAPVGHLAQPELEAWMRDLVKNYFLGLRSQAEPTESE